jgi:hypothetical protein
MMLRFTGIDNIEASGTAERVDRAMISRRCSPTDRKKVGLVL